jgi:membrane associated rhomboid family serine protease
MYNQRQLRFGGPITPMVKKLMIINGSIFILQQFVDLVRPGYIEYLFGLNHSLFIGQLYLWQIFTYMFIHGGWFHIIFNLLALWMFAGELEEEWGSRSFLKYYIFSGLGAGFFIAILNAWLYMRYGLDFPTVGASGALYALLLAYGIKWPNREVLLWFILPIKMKYLLAAFGLIEFFGTLNSAAGRMGSVSHIGHMGGLIAGFILLQVLFKKKGKGRVGTFFTKRRVEKKRKEIETRIKAKKIIDETLEKISKRGMSSLTDEEKSRLEWARRHYTPDNNDTIH